MKIGIMSDSHDNLPKLAAAVDCFNRESVDLVIHAGDFVAPFTKKPLEKLKSPLVAVFGNNDGEVMGLAKCFEGSIFPAPHSITFHGKTILICHEPIALKALQKSEFYDAVIYGHTHEIDVREGRTWIINPGETGGWLTGTSTIAIWDFDLNKVEIIHI